MASRKPGLETFGRKRDRVRLGNADRVEPERLGALDEGALERLSVLYRWCMIRANNRFPLVLIML